jgi:exopolysaccharide production protein ExoZ
MRQKLEVLQCGRALAALAVLLHHSALGADAFAGTSPPLATIINHGYLGVDFFFVLSGFIILSTHIDDPKRPAFAARYLRKRLIRIFVPYLPVCLGLIALYSILPQVSAADRNWSLLTSLTLIPTGSPPALSVAWTLVHEMLFYIIFLGFFFTRWFPWLAGVWAVLIVAQTVAGPLELPAAGAVLLSPLNLEFIAGMIAALIVRIQRLPALPFLAVGSLVTVGYFAFGYDAARVWFGIGMALLTIGFVRLEQVSPLHIPATFILLGDASYAIYLVHNPAISALARAAKNLGWWPCFLISAIVATGLGLFYHLWLDTVSG